MHENNNNLKINKIRMVVEKKTAHWFIWSLCPRMHEYLGLAFDTVLTYIFFITFYRTIAGQYPSQIRVNPLVI